jgi:hypothetical protein
MTIELVKHNAIVDIAATLDGNYNLSSAWMRTLSKCISKQAVKITLFSLHLVILNISMSLYGKAPTVYAWKSIVTGSPINSGSTSVIVARLRTDAIQGECWKFAMQQRITEPTSVPVITVKTVPAKNGDLTSSEFFLA